MRKSKEQHTTYYGITEEQKAKGGSKGITHFILMKNDQ